MAGLRGFGFRTRWVAWSLLYGLCFASGLNGVPLAAQDAPAYTLHAYTDAIQIPVLVLSRKHEPIKPVAADRFSVSLDGGPQFRATHVRLEGDDPVSLSILIDVSEPQAELLPKIGDAIAGLAPLSLRPQDHVSVFAMDCSLIRTLNDVPADPERLKRRVEAALQPWGDRGRKFGVGCRQTVHLWDALALMTTQLSKLPGRRVILAVTDGADLGSAHTWNELRRFAQASGVAIFGLSDEFNESSRLRFQNIGQENPFNSVCELSGGLWFTVSKKGLSNKLRWFTDIVRGRYIVEFPRPFNGAIGLHNLSVSIAKSDAFVRSSGISVPIADPAVLADPTTVPSDPSLTPELGNHRVLTPPH
jgi:hypothetical protein